MARKIIGIPGSSNSDKMFGVTGNYIEFANKYGDVRIIMPWEEKVEVDLLILPGGMDIRTDTGGIPSYQNTNTDVFKQFFYDNRLGSYINNTPILGICLGMQQLAVYFDSVLTQHIPFHAQSSNRWQTAHTITFTDNVHQPEKEKMKVNSHHHQCITFDNLNDSLEMIAFNEDYHGMIVEAFRHKELPIYGLQYHPEELYDSLSDNIINNILADVGIAEQIEF